jgi:hypothetical protein
VCALLGVLKGISRLSRPEFEKIGRLKKNCYLKFPQISSLPCQKIYEQKKRGFKKQKHRHNSVTVLQKVFSISKN